MTFAPAFGSGASGAGTNVSAAYGEILLTGGVTGQTTNVTPGVFDKVTGFTANGVSSGTTPAHASDNITLDTEGAYTAVFACPSFGGTASETLTFRFYLDGAAVTDAQAVVAADGGQVYLVKQIDATAGQVLDVRIASTAISDTFTPAEMSLSVQAIGAGNAAGYVEFTQQSSNPGGTPTNTIYDDDGTNYEAGTLVWGNKAVITGETSIGAPGTEQGSVAYKGGTYDAILKVNDFGGTRVALAILHRHSTTQGAGILLTRSHSDDATHAVVLADDVLADIVFGGHDGTDYNPAAQIRAAVDGTPGTDDMPGRLEFYTTPDGSNTLTLALTLDSSQNATFAGTVNGRTLATDGTKLDGIEAAADVTDAANVAAAGAVMDSDYTAGSGVQRKTGAGAYEANDVIDAGVGTTITALTDAATIAIDASLGNVYTVTLGGSRTVGAPTNPRNGQVLQILITQDGTGSRTLAWNAVFLWPGGTAPTLTTTAGATDVVSAVYNGTSWFAVWQGDFS